MSIVHASKSQDINAIAALTGTRIRRLPFSKTIKIY